MRSHSVPNLLFRGTNRPSTGSATAEPFDARQQQFSFTNFLLISTLYVSALNVFVAGFRLSPLMTLVRLGCFVYHRYDRDELEVSNEVIYWQSSPGVPVVEGGHGEEMQ
jgi:hypothetical protein